MSISSEVRKAGPFAGNDVITDFPFSFKVFSTADVLVVRADSKGAEYTLKLGTDYTVSLNANQNTSPGGTVVKASPLVTGDKIVITSRVANLQPTDLTNQGGFYPAVINAALDRATIQIQQLSEKVDRSAKLPITRTEDADALSSDIVVLADNLSSVNTVAGSIGGVNTVAGISANVTTVANNTANINAAVADLPALAAKVSKTGDTMTGPLSVPAGATGAQVPRAQEVVSKTGDTMTGNLTVPSLNGGQLAGHRNKLINGDFSQNVRGLTSVADDAYCLDRWYVLTETGNVTVGQLTDPESGAPWGIRLTQPDATAKRIGFAQIIESKNIRQFASKAMNLSARLRLSTAANIRYAVIEHTGDADVVTSDVVNNWASATFTPSNFFIAGVNIISTGTIAPGAATWGEVSDWDALGAGVKNVIVFVWTESQVAQNVTLDCSRIQYEPGVVATPHEWRMDERILCARYARLNGGLSGWSVSTTELNGLAVDFGSTPMFSKPAISLLNGVGAGHDPGIASRDISSPVFGGGTNLGGYVQCTITATTANKLHNVLTGALLFTAEL